MEKPLLDHGAKVEAGVYKTPDLYQAAFLLTRGITLTGTEKAEGRTFFFFRDKGEIAEIIEQYYRNASVPALSFKAALREMKSLVHGGFAGGRT